MQRFTRRKSPKKITKLRLILQAISLMSMIATRPIYACSLLVLRVQGGIQDLVGLVAGDKCLVFGLPGLVASKGHEGLLVRFQRCYRTVIGSLACAPRGSSYATLVVVDVF